MSAQSIRARIRSIHLDRYERPLGASVWTQYGIVQVKWQVVSGDRCWLSAGIGDAKREAVPAIEHIEQMCESMH